MASLSTLTARPAHRQQLCPRRWAGLSFLQHLTTGSDGAIFSYTLNGRWYERLRRFRHSGFGRGVLPTLQPGSLQYHR